MADELGLDLNRGSRLEPIISASEIASWAYCPEAWRLETGLKLPSVNAPERAAGERHHVATARVERAAGGSIALGRVLLALAAILAVFLVLRWVWG